MKYGLVVFSSKRNMGPWFSVASERSARMKDLRDERARMKDLRDERARMKDLRDLKAVVLGRTIDKADEGYDAARVAHEVANPASRTYLTTYIYGLVLESQHLHKIVELLFTIKTTS